MTSRNRVFISYSHKDKKWLAQLQVHLKPLVRSVGIELWDDTRIRPGQRWKEEIRKALAEAKVAILLISADYLASDFIIEDELPPLLEAAAQRGLVVLTVILSPSLFKEIPSLSQYQAVNDPSRTLAELRASDRESLGKAH